jgi:hypothetical protein
MRAARAVLALVALLAATELLLVLAARARGNVVVDVGPSTGAYGTGFTASEERPPTTFRWTRDHATLALPVVVARGPAVLSVRHQGAYRQPVVVHVLVQDQEIGTFPAQAGPFRVAQVPVALPAGPLRIDLLPEGPADPGIAIDWIRIEGASIRLPLAVWAPRVLVAGAFMLALAAGFGVAASAAAAFGLLLALAAWAAGDPFACAHVLTRIALPGLALCGLGLLLMRQRPHARWLVLLLLAGYLTKGAALFHPSYFYNDVRNNRRYVQALGGRDGTLLERSHRAQLQIGVAYPRIVGGKKYAFPYSPVFFLPFTLLAPEPLVIDEAMKHAVLVLAAAQVLLAFWLAGLAFGPSAGWGAAFVAALLPIYTSRLLLALWATLGGHFFDTLMIGCALVWAARPESRRAGAAFTASATASLLTYVASLFSVSLFAGFAALEDRKRALRILLVWAAGVALTIGLFYREFAWTFATEILPAALRGGGGGGDAGGPLDGLATALDRVRIFYGFGLPALAAAGFVLLRRRAALPARRTMIAYALAFLAMVVLRSLPSGLFKDLKEMEFVAPLVAVTVGASLEELASRGRAGRAAASLIAIGLVAFGVSRYLGYVAAWTALAPA